MRPNKDQIVTILIKLSRKDPLTEKELSMLQIWSEEDEKNKQLIDEFEDDKEFAKQWRVFASIPVESDWQSFVQKNKIYSNKKTFKLKRYIPWAAAILLLPLFYIGKQLFYTKDVNYPIPKIELSIQSKDINPASNNAELILADGTHIILDEHTKGQKLDDFRLDLNDNVLKLQRVAAEKTTKTVWNTISVPKGAYYTIVMDDNTIIRLNASSKLIFPSQFDDKERKVKLEGEAFFEVSHQHNTPFFVESKNIEIKVLGTSFNVNAYSDKVRTTLASGSVQLKSKEESMLLKPGQFSLWTGHSFVLGTADLAKELAWKNGEFFFRKDNIIDIAYELSRWYGMEVKFMGKIDLKKLYSGSISRKSTLSKVLEVLKFGSDFDFEIRDNELLIKENLN